MATAPVLFSSNMNDIEIKSKYSFETIRSEFVVTFFDAPNRLVGLLGFERRGESILCEHCGYTSEKCLLCQNIYSECVQVYVYV